MELIAEYFPDLTEGQLAQLAKLGDLTREWNSKVNLISRKDIDNFEVRHLLHSLAIQRFIRFAPGTRVMDLGTGGGLPGLPLAIVNPEVKFVLIDGRGKKITAVQDMIRKIKLPNAEAHHIRAEDYQGKFDFVVSRAVAPMDKLYGWSRRLLKKDDQNALPNGLIALKGGDVETELAALDKRTYTEYYPISDFFGEEEFEEKYVVYAQR